MIRLGRNGVEWSYDDEWRALQEEMRTRHCVLLEDFLSPSFISLVRPLLTTERFVPYQDGDPKGKCFAREMRLEASDPLAGLFAFCLNSPRLYRAVGELAGLGEDVRYFISKTYKMFPAGDDFDSWHDDAYCGRRLLGLSINLGTEPTQGGEFQIRDRSGAGRSNEPYRTIKNNFGAACLFRIDERLVHRVSPLEGTVPRFCTAGWFVSQPDLRDIISAAAGSHPSGKSTTGADVGVGGVENTQCRD